jgi:AcrR family transcriptional regulator
MQVTTCMPRAALLSDRVSTEDRILDAALGVFAEVGFRGATTRRIAEVAGVNEVTLFRRFRTKEELLLAAMRRDHLREPPLTLPEQPIDPVAELTLWTRVHLARLMQGRVLIRSSMCELGEHPELCATAGSGPARVALELGRYLERVREAGLAEGDWDPRIAASLLMGALFADAVGRDVIPDRHPYDVDETAMRYVSLFARAIGVAGADR